MARIDGRLFDQLRPVGIQCGYTSWAEGSILIEMGGTRVLCNATVEETVPHHVAAGGWVTAEYSMLPRANRQRTPRDISRLKLSPRSAEIQRLIGRSLRAAVDLELLGPRQIIIDCDVLQGDGGTRTASVTGGFIAMALACRKLLDAGLIKTMPIKTFVAGVSAGIVGGRALLDLCYEEDSAAQVDLNCVMTANDEIIEIQATGERRPFTAGEHAALMELALSGIKNLIKIQQNILGTL